jgi:bacteriorhodopsin
MQRTWLWVVVAVVVILLIYFFMGSRGTEPTTEAPATGQPPAATETTPPATEPAAPEAPANN